MILFDPICVVETRYEYSTEYYEYDYNTIVISCLKVKILQYMTIFREKLKRTKCFQDPIMEI